MVPCRACTCPVYFSAPVPEAYRRDRYEEIPRVGLVLLQGRPDPSTFVPRRPDDRFLAYLDELRNGGA